MTSASSPDPVDTPAPTSVIAATVPFSAPHLLAWPAWRRVLAMLPIGALLWLAVAWAQGDVAPW